MFWDEPPTRRNQVWQFDVSEFETTSGGRWQLGGCCDHVTGVKLDCAVRPTATAPDMVAALDTAVANAELLVGRPLASEFIDPATGELTSVLAIVTDNGGPMRSAAVARRFTARTWAVHVCSRHRSPGTTGVIERFSSTRTNRTARPTSAAYHPAGPTAHSADPAPRRATPTRLERS